jgi:hypothetical protein
LRHAVQAASAPISIDFAFARVAKEIVRAGVAFVVFLVLLPPWRWSGLGRAYGKAVMAVAQVIFVPTQHFPLLTRLDNLTLHNLDHIVILTVALFLVSTNLGNTSRVKRFASALVVIFAYHVIVTILTVKVQATQELLTSMNILVLSPVEFRLVDWFRYFAYDLGLEVAPFVMMLLTVVWNLNPGPDGRTTRRRGDARDRRGRPPLAFVAIGLGVLATLCSAASFYARSRETDPRHVDAHAKIGHLLWNSHRDAQAEEQYRLALAGGTTDPEVYYNLAGLEARSGHRGAALQRLDEGLRMALDPAWESRFQKAIRLVHQGATSTTN